MTGFQDLDSALAHDHFHLACLPPSRRTALPAPSSVSVTWATCASLRNCAPWRSKCIMQASYIVPHDSDLITSLSLLVEDRCQLSFALDPSGMLNRRGANDFKGGQFTSK